MARRPILTPEERDFWDRIDSELWLLGADPAEREEITPDLPRDAGDAAEEIIARRASKTEE